MKKLGQYQNLRELATCGHDDDLWQWINDNVTNDEQFGMLAEGKCADHLDMTEKRMHMLFVCEATE